MSNKIKYKDKPWVSYYDEGVPEKLVTEEICLPAMLERTAAEFPQKAALLFEGYCVTYTKLKEMVDRLATCLAAFGVRKRDSVAILLPNMIQCVVSYFAILKIGAIAVMNNPLYSDRELEYQFADSGAKVLITLDLLGNRMIDLRTKTNIKQIIYTRIGDYLPFPKNILFPVVAKLKHLSKKVKHAPNVYKWKDVINDYPPRPPLENINLSDVAMYQYTGGTTGLTKGAILTHKNLSSQVQHIRVWLPRFRRGEETILGALPFFHVFGITTTMNLAVYMGWTDILIIKPHAKPLLDAIKRFKPTFAPLVPTMYIGIINHPDVNKSDITSIEGCFSGSAPLPLEVIREFEKKSGSIIVEGYGLTESSPVTHINPFNGKRKPGSIGLALPDTECKIVDLKNNKKEVAVGQIGELLIKGPQVMRGYLNKPEETRMTLKDGWLHTGDIAKMDNEGYFYIVDRKKDMIISSGYNVYPRDIEEVLFDNPKIQEAAVIGIPHPKRGEVAKAFVVLKEGEVADVKEILDFCKDKLAKYKLPAEIDILKELPKSKVGKVLKRELREAEIQKHKGE